MNKTSIFLFSFLTVLFFLVFSAPTNAMSDESANSSALRREQQADLAAQQQAKKENCVAKMTAKDSTCNGLQALSRSDCAELFNACMEGRPEAQKPAPSKEFCESIATSRIHENCINVADEMQRQECLETEYQKCLSQLPPGEGGTVLPIRSAPPGYDGPIPDCAFTYGGCRDVNDILRLIINIGEFIFKIIGSIAFVFFIYGGVTMIAAFGSAEKFQKGRDILVAAVIGLVISFSAYLLIQFLLETLGVSAGLQSIK